MHDYYALIKNNNKPKPKFNGIFPPNNRILIAGDSGSRKTNTALNILDLIPYTQIYIYAKSKGVDPLYDDLLIPKIKKVEKKHKTQILMDYENNLKTLPNLEELDVNEVKVFIFDDLMNCSTEDMTKIKNYFIAGRKYNTEIIYITQCYSETDKTIRTNSCTKIITDIFSGTERRTTLLDICGKGKDYERGVNLYERKKNVFIQTINENNQPVYNINF